jgi:hypothetical protein
MFPNLFITSLPKTQNNITKIRSQELEHFLKLVQVTKSVIHYKLPFFRYLANGYSFRDLHFSYRIGISTASKVVREVCLSIWSVMRPECIPQPTK